MIVSLQNIHNKRSSIHLFERLKDGSLKHTIDNSFSPYFFEADTKGQFNTYDGKKATKVVCAEPSEVAKARSPHSYEADILFTKRYLIDRITEFEKVNPKYFFIDIEVLAKDMPKPEEAKDPISCVTIYNSHNKEYKTWFLNDSNYMEIIDLELREATMLQDVINYIKKEKPDLILAWNVNFDYTYLHNRIKDFAKQISPIGESRYGEGDTYYPAGISILDYMAMFKKIFMREQSYALDKVAQKYLNEEAWAATKFGVLEEIVKLKNINDVKRMVKLEEKFKVIDYYDEIRRYALCLWEDLTANSKILDMIILREARNRNIILPNKSRDEEVEEFQGAYRRADVGVFENVYKADVASMYPNQLINFCLDTQNIIEKEESNKKDNQIEINETIFKQNSNALLPYLSQSLISQKDNIKKQLSHLDIKSEEYENTKRKYDAIKGLVNSLYGVMAFPYFRLYNLKIASSITFLARDLLSYVEEKMRSMSYQVIYTDTDALMYKADEDETELLNRLVKDWAIEKYGKTDIDITFENEGQFTKILIIGKCHYYGYITSSKGTKKEIKGMEIKRSSSSKYEAGFQEILINKILEKESKEVIVDWIRLEQERIKTLPLNEVAFPCKVGTKEYVNEPIFIRAYNNSFRMFPNFRPSKGELFYYIFVKPMGSDKNGKRINVLAFLDPKLQPIESHLIDWEEISRRNIITKTNTIFEALGWGNILMALNFQQTLF